MIFNTGNYSIMWCVHVHVNMPAHDQLASPHSSNPCSCLWASKWLAFMIHRFTNRKILPVLLVTTVLTQLIAEWMPWSVWSVKGLPCRCLTRPPSPTCNATWHMYMPTPAGIDMRLISIYTGNWICSGTVLTTTSTWYWSQFTIKWFISIYTKPEWFLCTSVNAL